MKVKYNEIDGVSYISRSFKIDWERVVAVVVFAGFCIWLAFVIFH